MPEGDDKLDFKIVEDSYYHVLRTNKIILGPVHSLFDPDTYTKFGLKIEDNEYIVDFASRANNIQFLDLWKKSGWKLSYTSDSLDYASARGHIDVLNWWINSGFELLYTSNAIDLAFESGHIDILDLWKSWKEKFGFRIEIFFIKRLGSFNFIIKLNKII